MISVEEALVSVIVSVYNVEAYLPKCLDSIANQTYRNLEIILVDDGSTDGSGRICDEYAAKDSRARVIHQSNKGLWAARNAGQDAANGAFLLFLDSDDYCHYDMIRQMYGAITRDEGYDVAIVDMKITPHDDEDCKSMVDCKWEEGLPGQMVSCLIDFNYPYSVVWNKMYRAEAIQGLRARPFPVAQDLDFNIHAFMHFRRAIGCRQVMYYWYSHRGQITKTAQYLKILPYIYYTNYIEDLSGRCAYDYVILDALYRKMALLKARSIKAEDKSLIFSKCKQYYKRTISDYLNESRIPVKVRTTYMMAFHFPYLASLFFRLFERHPRLYKQLKL